MRLIIFTTCAQTRDPRDMLVAHFFAAKHLAGIADQTAAAAAAAASTSSSATTTSTASSSTSNSSQVKVVAPAVQNTSSSPSPNAAAKKAPTVATPKITEPPKGPPGGLGAARPKRLRGGLAPEAAAAEMQKRVAEAQKWRALGVDAYALAHASAFTGLEERMLVAKHSFEQSGCQVNGRMNARARVCVGNRLQTKSVRQRDNTSEQDEEHRWNIKEREI